MPETVPEMHGQSHPGGETAVVWDPAPEVIRYGVIVGHAGIAVPSLDTIMRGQAPSFALLGVPPRYSGAIDRNTPAGGGRQYGLVAYRGDGTLVAVSGVQVSEAAAAPRDREYYPLNVPALAAPPAPKAVAPPAPKAVAPPAPKAAAAAEAPPAPPSSGAHEPDAPLPPARPPATAKDAPPSAGPAPAVRPARTPTDRPAAGPEPSAPLPVAGPRVAASWVPLESGPRPATEGSTGQQSGVLTALLDEAALSLSVWWSDRTAAAHLLAQAAELAPADPRVVELQGRLRQAQPDGRARDIAALLREARACVAAREYWPAVALFGEVLARDAGHAEAREEAARARLLGRWSAQMAGAESDGPRLARIGDEFADVAPDLAVQAYAASFDARPTLATLRGWLLALARSGQAGEVAPAARRGVEALRQAGRLPVEPEHDAALAALAAAGTADDQGMPAAIERFLTALTPPNPGEGGADL